MAETTKKVVEKSTAIGSDYWKQEVEIRLPKAANGEANFMFVACNGKAYKIMRGVKTKVPAPIADIIEESFQAQDEADEFINTLISKN